VKRSSIDVSRKWGTYAIANLLFKIYFDVSYYDKAISTIFINNLAQCFEFVSKSHQLDHGSYRYSISEWLSKISSSNLQLLQRCYHVSCRRLRTCELPYIPSTTLLMPSRQKLTFKMRGTSAILRQKRIKSMLYPYIC